jgi:hypothetical protein
LKHNSKYQQNRSNWYKLSRKGRGCLLIAVLSTVAPLEDQDSSNNVGFACVFYNMRNKFITEQKYLCIRHLAISDWKITDPVHLEQETLA